MPALILSVPNLATKWAVHVHCHKVQNTEVIYITLNDHISCSQALTTKAKKNEHTTLLSQLQRVMHSVQDAEPAVYLLF